MAKKKSTAKREEITLTIRARSNQDIDSLNELKKETGLFAYSAALMKASSSYPEHLRMIREMQVRINDLVQLNRDQREIISAVIRAKRLTDGYEKKFLKHMDKFPEQEIPFDDH